MSENIKVITIIGPTAVGKTNLGIRLAKYLDGEIISGDSMQLYKELTIGTAKVTAKEMQGVPHHLIDIINVDDNYSVQEFQKSVRELIHDIHDRGRLPIIVGGTGLYIKAALYDYEFNEHPHQWQTNQKYENYDNQELYDYLVSIDAESAKILHPNNRRRVLRAIEIYEQSGEKKSDRLLKQEKTPIYDVFMIGLTCERTKLYQRINQRVDSMLENGLLEEINYLYHQKNVKSTMQSMQAIGYKEWFPYLEGKERFENTIDKIKQNSRNFAKRQMTWFKNQFDVHWFDVLNNNANQMEDTIIKNLLSSNFLNRIVVAGGCFWGVEAYYKKIKGICHTRVGYAQGYKENPVYHEVKDENTGHTEVVELLFNSTQISLINILDHLFRIIDPTSLNKQGGDIGTNYRTGVYYNNKEQENQILTFMNQQHKKYQDKIVVEVDLLKIFYNAEEYHQNYLDKNPNGYCHVSFDSIKDSEKKIVIRRK